MVLAGLDAIRQAALERDTAGLAGLSPEDRLGVVQDTLKVHGFLMFGVTRYVYPAYYQHPRVLEGLGEPPRPPFPEGYEVEATDPRLLEKLLTRQRK
jgi:hypothetical protein